MKMILSYLAFLTLFGYIPLFRIIRDAYKKLDDDNDESK